MCRKVLYLWLHTTAEALWTDFLTLRLCCVVLWQPFRLLCVIFGLSIKHLTAFYDPWFSLQGFFCFVFDLVNCET